MGDYTFDNTAGAGEAYEYNYESGYQPSRSAALAADAQALRKALWLMADDQYKAALTAYLKKKAGRVHALDPSDKDGSFAKQRAVTAERPVAALQWDPSKQSDLAERLSRDLSALPVVFNHEVQLQGQRRERVFVSSEGAELVYGRTLYSVQLSGLSRTADGIIMEMQRAFYAATPDKLPVVAELRARRRRSRP